jgi:hypothetical protein
MHAILALQSTLARHAVARIRVIYEQTRFLAIAGRFRFREARTGTASVQSGKRYE